MMRSFWFDPYLWIHLAGLAALPLFVEGCLVGFAMGDPIFPAWLELLLVALMGSVPILLMQWQRPFYIFSVVAATVKPEQLTDDQKRLLQRFKAQRNRVLAILVPVPLMILLWKIYTLAPIAAPAVAFLPEWHLLGLLLAAASFFACNLFAQVPISVASVMLTSETDFAGTPPFALDSIRRSFTLVGLPLNRVLPPVRLEVKPALGAVAAPVATDVIAPVSQLSSHDSLTNDVWAEVPAGNNPLTADDTETAASSSPTDEAKAPASDAPDSQ